MSNNLEINKPVLRTSVFENSLKPLILNCGSSTTSEMPTEPLPSIPHLYFMSAVE